MTIHLISFASILHKQVSLRSSHEAILSEIEKYYTVKFVDYQDMDKLKSDDFKIIFVATGGVERLVIQHFENLPRPAIYWQTVCRILLLPHWKFPPGYGDAE